jgi:hypothetical protein
MCERAGPLWLTESLLPAAAVEAERSLDRVLALAVMAEAPADLRERLALRLRLLAVVVVVRNRVRARAVLPAALAQLAMGMLASPAQLQGAMEARAAVRTFTPVVAVVAVDISAVVAVAQAFAVAVGVVGAALDRQVSLFRPVCNRAMARL